MTATLRTITTATCVVVLAVLLFPTSALAQRRRAVPVVRSRPAVSVGVYYGPRVYRPYYGYPLYRPYYSPWYPPYYGYYGGYDLSGSMRLQVAPRDTQVFVDGYYAGIVDQFDGVFQRLNVEPGAHALELYLPGHRIYRQEVYLQPGRTFNIRHAMQPLAPGEPEPVQPSGVTTRRPDGPPRSRRPQDSPPALPRESPRDDQPRGARAPINRSDFGTLTVRVQPGDASIRIDGESWEGSDDSGRLTVQLGAGVHTVEIRRDGYRTYITDVTVRPDDRTPLNVVLTAN